MATSEDVKQLFAEFPQDAISWRAQSVNKEGTKALALAYIDARDVMDRLDQMVGVAEWQDRYEFSGTKTICYLSVRVDGEWITKADGAGDTDVEAEKGAISDAFKRAAVKWGIGRYLYEMSAPWVPCESYEKNGKHYWKRWKEDPWVYVKGAKPARSAASLKKTDASGNDAWGRLERDLENDFADCHSLVTFEKLSEHYRQRARAERWPKDWLDLLAGKFRDLKASLPDADGVFPGDVASNPLVQNYSAM